MLSVEEAQRIVNEAPRKADKTCPHPADRQIRDGGSYVCLDCTVIQVIAW